MRRSQPRLLSRALFLAIAGSLACTEPVLCAETQHCDPALKPPANDPYAYRLRGDRCEGIYIRDVAGSTLNIVALTESVENFSASTEADLQIEWSALPNAPVQLRAQALRPRLYYRMDSVRPAGTASYAWPPQLLRALKLGRNELGLLAWTARTIAGRARTLYLPLRVGQQKPLLRSTTYQLVLLPGVELDEVFVTLAPVTESGKREKPVIEDKPLERGYYPADKPLAIDLPALARQGLYEVEIGAQLRGSGVSATRLWLYGGGA
jgi:hypothetical protein